MVLELSKSFQHSCGKNAQRPYSEQEIKSMMLQMMERQGIPSNHLSTAEDGVLRLEGIPNLKLHTLMLQVEELGLQMKYTKKTIIEIC